MSQLNGDVLYLILKELQNDKKSLFSCLRVNKTWCEIIVPILWKNPWKFLEERKSLCKVVTLHLSDETKKNLKSQGFDFLTNFYHKPLFNYISFCKILNLYDLHVMVNTFDHIVTFPNIKKEIFEKEVTSLFINENTRVMHLYIKNRYNNRLNTIPGAKYSFSELEFFSSNTNISDNVIIGLPEIFKSIKRLELVIEMKNNSYEFVKLIDNIDKLYHIRLYSKHYAEYDNDSFRKALENSLIKHANTIQYFKTTRPPVTNILSSFVNLKILKVKGFSNDLSWDCLETLSLSFLQVLKTDCIPIEKVSALIENTGGKLIEVSINGGYHDENNNKRLIQSIYNKCKKIQYLKILIRNENISELEKLLIDCQYLDGLNINVYNDETIFDWNYFFKVLYESSPTNLFKFKFSFVNTFELESLRLFLNNWNGRHPLLFQTIQYSSWGINNVLKRSYFDVINLYITQGIVSLYTHAPVEKYDFKDFDWIKADKKALKSWEYNF
ncbi:uncharacterized protein OCT59_029429 [Rhizophagus irregularis]|uniref:F-box domain-containing protein n=1 Tax=Rhizophagus irregularis (strain DAOM 197198w) TaxID=1432141 RepID=A0A015KC79_RHIIW|nr:hypothetical protein RirG_136490 [Rhizophagus irregularis DAOM 197198w]UZO09192.1 hypothetical protein OCT59_029429 [Rhizophagus irregularis]GBC49084.1 hypothetical protein GLOIN_2v1841955 [Rhizophagus irregularis DAOM 181602=DAOM 197198]